MDSLVYAIDFDGTLCQNEWPDIGPPRMTMIHAVKNIKADGNKIILWTCREGESLIAAVDWCKCHGLVFDSVNANLPERIDLYGDCRKIGANYYIDDRNMSIDDFLWGLNQSQCQN